MNRELEDALRRYRNGIATPEEEAMVETWYAQWHSTDRVSLSEEDLTEAEKLMREVVMGRIHASGRRVSMWKTTAAAAAVVVCLFGYWYWSAKWSDVPEPSTISKYDVAPPSDNKATVTLANGKVVYLDSVGNGTLAKQGTILLSKTGDGQIIYKGLGGQSAIAYNTLSNPRGSRVIDLVLADGTRVWLNSASSLTYPVAFTGKERTVTITGEAYFEVAHNSAIPFRVKAGGSVIEDIGTSFDVNTYKDEPFNKTTLVEGSVRVSASGEDKVLRPGDQAMIGAHSFDIQQVDVGKVIAWKEGYFAFEQADIQTVMRQLSRWYDVDISIEGTPSERSFSGELGRSLTLTQVLTLLGKERIKYKITGPRKLLIVD